jgi:hypothetical protein
MLAAASAGSASIAAVSAKKRTGRRITSTYANLSKQPASLLLRSASSIQSLELAPEISDFHESPNNLFQILQQQSRLT